MPNKALVVSTTFLGVDKLTQTVKRMTASVSSFGVKATSAFNRVQRAERRLRKGISGLIGKLGSLGLAFGGLALAMTIGTANVQLEDNLASLSAITGVTGDAFKSFEHQIDKVSKKQKVFAGDTAKAFEVVGSAKPELLASADALGMVTDAVITLSKASGDDLQLSAENLTGAMNQFNLGADQANRTINALAAGSVAGSANITKINESLVGFGAVADAANITLEESIGLVETLGTKSLFGAEAGTALRGTILRLQAAGVGYKSGIFNINDALEEARKKADSFGTALERDAFMQKTFGQRNIVTGNILLENIDKFKGFTKAVTGTNTAFEQADIKMNTLKGRYTEMIAAFKNATTTTDSQSESLQKVKDAMIFVGDNMERIISFVWKLVKGFIAYKSIMIATKIAIVSYNIALGIMGALSGSASIAIGSSAVALGAYNVATSLATAAQWLLNAAMWGFPLTWILAALAAVVAGIILLVKNWDEIVATFENDWSRIKNKFQEEGLGGVFKMWGQELLIQVIDPLIGIFAIIAKISKEKFGLETLKSLGATKSRLLEETGQSPEQQAALNPDATVEQVRTERIEKTKNEKVDINLTANPGTNAEIINDESGMVKLSNTLGWQPT